MNKRAKILKIWIVVTAMLLCISGCGIKGNSNVTDNESGLVEAETESKNADSRESTATETTAPSQKEISVPDEKPQSNQVVETDLEPSEGLEFESNGDGTCTITGIGTCTDQNIVIPLESPDGDIVTLIGKYALYSLENVNSITLVNYTYEVDENTFQYGEFTAVNIIGGSPVINKSAFSSCEDLVSISFSDCNIQADEYAFYSCGKDADVSFSNCTGIIEENAFQYSSLESLTIIGSMVDMGDSVFSSCEDLVTVNIDCDSVILGEYAFYSCEDLKSVTICENAKSDNEIKIDDRVFQYCKRLETVNIGNGNIETGEAVFSGCADNLAIIVAGKNYTADTIKDGLK